VGLTLRLSPGKATVIRDGFGPARVALLTTAVAMAHESGGGGTVSLTATTASSQTWQFDARRLTMDLNQPLWSPNRPVESRTDPMPDPKTTDG
jgi:hypothetical protein